MLGFKNNEKRPHDTPLGVLDRMSWRTTDNGVMAFHRLPIIDQHNLLMKAWDQKGNLKKAQPHARELYFSELVKQGYDNALDIAEKYELKDEIKEAAEWIYDTKKRGGELEGALEIAVKYKLGRRIADAALELYTSKMEKYKYAEALRIAKEHNLTGQVKECTQTWYEYCMHRSDWSTAANIAARYGFGKEKVREPALKECLETIGREVKREDQMMWIRNGSISEEELTALALKVCINKISGESFAAALNIAKDYRVNTELLKEAASEACGRLMQKGEYGEAVVVARMFSLEKHEEFADDLRFVLNHSKY